MANPITTFYHDQCEKSKLLEPFSVEGAKYVTIRNSPLGYGPEGSTFSRGSQHTAVGTNDIQRFTNGVLRRYSNKEPPSNKKSRETEAEPRSIQELAKISSRRYSIGELKAIGESGFWEEGCWVLWKPILALGGLGSSVTSTSSNQKDESKILLAEPCAPRIKPLNELKSAAPAGASDEGEGVLLSSPAMVEMERAAKSASAISFSDSEDIYSADERESRGQSHDFITPKIPFEGRAELYERLNPEPQKSIATQSPVNTPELVVPGTDSDIESLKSVSEPGSDIESWVNEPSTAELETQLQEKHDLAKTLFCKLQAAEAQLEGLKFSHEKQLQEKHREYSKAVEGYKTLYKSLKDAYIDDLQECKMSCHRLLNVAEKRRLAELAEVGKEIQKFNDEWTAERTSLIAKLEAKTKSHEAANSPATDATYATIAEQYKFLNLDALKLADKSHKVQCYCQGTQEDDSVEVPVSALKTQIRNLGLQIVHITEEQKTDKKMHEKLRNHYFSLHKKYADLASTPEGVLVPDLERQIASLNKARSPTVLERQNKSLTREIAVLKATRKRESELRNAINNSLVAKYNSLSEDHDQLRTHQQSVQESQNDVEPQQKDLQQYLIDLKVSIENMREAQEARYNLLDTRFSSLSSQTTTPKSENEKAWLEKRLLESENETKLARQSSMESSSRAQDLTNFIYKLKSDNEKLARGHKRATEIQICLGGEVHSLRAQYEQSTAANDKLQCDHDALQHDRATLQADHDTLQASHQKLEKAHEIAQEAHKVLGHRLQKANLRASSLQKKLNETRGLDTSPTRAAVARTPRHPIQVRQAMRIEDALRGELEGEEQRAEMRALEKVSTSALDEAVSSDKAAVVGLEEITATATAGTQQAEE